MSLRRFLLLLTALCMALCGCAASPRGDVPDLMFRYADNQTEEYPTVKAAEYFAELVEEGTDGRIRIRVYPNGELGDEISVFEQMQFGGIDFARFSCGTLSQFVPEMEVLELPYLFRDADHMLRVLDGEIGDALMEAIGRTGLTGLSWFDAGARNFYTRTPVDGLDGLSGMTIRVQESDFMCDIVRLLGVEPVQLAYSDVYSALQTGKIDGAENNWPSYESAGHNEPAPYYLLSGHFRLPEAQVVSVVAMEKIRALDPSFEDVIFHCARAAALYERTLWKEREAESEALVRERGCVVTAVSSGEKEEFQKNVLETTWSRFPEESQNLIQRILSS